MKNVQMASFSRRLEAPIFALTEEEFALMFPEPGQDIEFDEDIYKRLGDERGNALLRAMYSRELKKSEVKGIHGTMFYQNQRAKQYYPTKRRAEMIRTPLDVRPHLA